jgi:TolB-like protein
MRGLLAELQRRKVYRAAAAYAVVAWLLIQIATQVFPFFDVPNWGVRLTVLLIVLGFPIAVAMAWAFDLTEDGILRADPKGSSRGRRSAIVIWAALSLVVLAAYYFVTPNTQRHPVWRLGATTTQQNAAPLPADVKSIAVLPFVDLSQNKDQEYFGDGISEELAGTLARIEGLRVAARTSSFSFKNTAIDVHVVGQKLNVGSVLEGSIRRDGQRIRVSAELIDATTGFDCGHKPMNATSTTCSPSRIRSHTQSSRR